MVPNDKMKSRRESVKKPRPLRAHNVFELKRHGNGKSAIPSDAISERVKVLSYNTEKRTD